LSLIACFEQATSFKWLFEFHKCPFLSQGKLKFHSKNRLGLHPIFNQ